MRWIRATMWSTSPHHEQVIGKVKKGLELITKPKICASISKGAPSVTTPPIASSRLPCKIVTTRGGKWRYFPSPSWMTQRVHIHNAYHGGGMIWTPHQWPSALLQKSKANATKEKKSNNPLELRISSTIFVITHLKRIRNPPLQGHSRRHSRRQNKYLTTTWIFNKTGLNQL